MKLLKISGWFWPVLFVYIIFTGNPILAANCRGLLEPKFEFVNQHDPKFRSEGLFTENGVSMLCGPVCIINSLAKLNIIRTDNLLEASVQLIKRLFPSIGVKTSSIVNDGVEVLRMEAALKLILEQMVGNFDVTLKVYDFSDEDLYLVNKPNTVVIAMLEGWGQVEDFDLVSLKNRKFGHFSILSSVQKVNDDTYVATFDDPSFGEVSSKLVRISAPNMPYQFPIQMRKNNVTIDGANLTSIENINLMTRLLIIRKLE